MREIPEKGKSEINRVFTDVSDPYLLVGLGGLEPPTSPLSGAFGRALGESGSHPAILEHWMSPRLDGRRIDYTTKAIDHV